MKTKPGTKPVTKPRSPQLEFPIMYVASLNGGSAIRWGHLFATSYFFVSPFERNPNRDGMAVWRVPITREWPSGGHLRRPPCPTCTTREGSLIRNKALEMMSSNDHTVWEQQRNTFPPPHSRPSKRVSASLGTFIRPEQPAEVSARPAIKTSHLH